MSAPSAVELDLDLTANAAPPAPTPAVEDDHSLDFDLGGLGFEPTKPDAPVAPVAKPAPVTMAKAEPPAEVHADLAFNMDFDIPAAPASAPPAPSLDEFDLNVGGAPEPVAPALSLDDFDLDLGAPVRSAAASVRAEPESEFASLDLTAEFGMADLSTPFDLPKAAASDPLMDLDAMNVDLPTPSPVSAAAASASASAAARSPEPLASDPLMDLDAMNVDLPAAATPSASAAPTAGSEMDLSLDDPEQPTAAPASPVPKASPFDLSGIDLDLPGVSAAPEMQEETLGAIDESAELSALHMEMETKLDLALAYQEIGDKEGARELIDEVIKDGNAAQVAKATAVRAQLV